MSSLRVTSGSLRGRRVPVPPAGVRPTSERARQAFFDIVGERIVGSRFLDLFAGSGIFSFEAVSRGAASSFAIERDKRTAAAIEKLAGEWGAPVRAFARDVFLALPAVPESDIAYADPPYDFDRYAELLDAVSRSPLAPTAWIAIEHRRGNDPFGGAAGDWVRFRRAEYGEVWISLFRRSQEEEGT